MADPEDKSKSNYLYLLLILLLPAAVLAVRFYFRRNKEIAEGALRQDLSASRSRRIRMFKNRRFIDDIKCEEFLGISINSCGEVYKVSFKGDEPQDDNSKPYYTVKVYNQNDLINDKNKLLFVLRERDILSHIQDKLKEERDQNCDHYLKLHHAFHGTSYYFLCTEYVNGFNLKVYIETLKNTNGNFTIEFILNVIEQTSIGLHWFHKYRIIHRNISPPCILITFNSSGSMVVKITDYGSGKYLEEGDDFSSNDYDYNFGTDGYKAPEVIMRDSYDEAIDFWSLGVVILEMIQLFNAFELVNYQNPNFYVDLKGKNENMLEHFEKNVGIVARSNLNDGSDRGKQLVERIAAFVILRFCKSNYRGRRETITEPPILDANNVRMNLSSNVSMEPDLNSIAAARQTNKRRTTVETPLEAIENSRLNSVRIAQEGNPNFTPISRNFSMDEESEPRSNNEASESQSKNEASSEALRNPILKYFKDLLNIDKESRLDYDRVMLKVKETKENCNLKKKVVEFKYSFYTSKLNPLKLMHDDITDAFTSNKPAISKKVSFKLKGNPKPSLDSKILQQRSFNLEAELNNWYEVSMENDIAIFGGDHVRVESIQRTPADKPPRFIEGTVRIREKVDGSGNCIKILCIDRVKDIKYDLKGGNKRVKEEPFLDPDSTYKISRIAGALKRWKLECFSDMIEAQYQEIAVGKDLSLKDIGKIKNNEFITVLIEVNEDVNFERDQDIRIQLREDDDKFVDGKVLRLYYPSLTGKMTMQVKLHSKFRQILNEMLKGEEFNFCVNDAVEVKCKINKDCFDCYYGKVVSKVNANDTDTSCLGTATDITTYGIEKRNGEIEEGVTGDRIRLVSNRYLINLKENLDTCDIKEWDT